MTKNNDLDSIEGIIKDIWNMLGWLVVFQFITAIAAVVVVLNAA